MSPQKYISKLQLGLVTEFGSRFSRENFKILPFFDGFVSGFLSLLSPLEKLLDFRKAVGGLEAMVMSRPGRLLIKLDRQVSKSSLSTVMIDESSSDSSS